MVVRDEQIKTEQDYILRELKIIAFNGEEYDIGGMARAISFYEDLFDGFSGELLIQDSMDLPTLLPFVGEEEVRITFTKQDPAKPEGETFPDVTITVRVFSVENKTEINPKTQLYTLRLVSREFFQNSSTRIFKGWVNAKYSDMVGDIYDEYVKVDKEINVEETIGEYNFCLGNKIPFAAINMLASKSRASGSTNGQSNGEPFFFYEDRDEFHFKSVGALLSQEPVQTYIRRAANIRKDELTKKDIEKDFRRIENYEWKSSLNTLDKMRRGLYGQELVSVDPIRRKIDVKEFKISEEWESFPKLDTQKFFRDDAPYVDKTKSHRRVIVNDLQHDLTEHLTSRDAEIKSQSEDEYVMRRISKLLQMMSSRLAIVVPGDPRRKVGEMVTVEWPEAAGDIELFGKEKRREKDNKYYFGNYLIISLKHHIADTGYYTVMELCRDSFRTEIEHEDPFERFKDVL